MGCFSITNQKARKKLMMHQTQLPQPKPCVSYHNKPSVLPHPREVEQGRYARTLSTPAQFQLVEAAARSPSSYRQSRALSAPARVTLHHLYPPPVAVAMAEDAQPPSSPLCRRIIPLSDPALCERINKKAFGGRPVPLPSSLPLPPAAHPLPLPEGGHRCSSETTSHSSAAPLAFSPSRCCTPSREGDGKLGDPDLRMSSSLQPKPLPQPPPEPNTLAISPRIFTFNELAEASQNFSAGCCIGDSGNAIAYRSWILTEGKKTEVSVLQLTTPAFQDPKAFVTEATKMCALQHSHLCKLIGFCMEDSHQPKEISNKKTERFLVFESLPRGAAAKLLYGREDGGLLDWCTRIKIAAGAARGLAYLHERFCGEILYRDFCTFNIQIDQDFTAKLTGYGYGFLSNSRNKFLPVSAHVSPETATNGSVSPKSNVWSFGVVMLELLTGQRILDAISVPAEQDPTQRSKKFAADCSRLGMDPALRGCYPLHDAKLVADMALRCLHHEPDLRPSMKEVVEILSFVEDRSSTGRNRPQENADMRTNLSFKPFSNPFLKQAFLSSEHKAAVLEAS